MEQRVQVEVDRRRRALGQVIQERGHVLRCAQQAGANFFARIKREHIWALQAA